MKKMYNKYSTSDIPLDASLEVPSGPTSKMTNTAKKATIKAIGTKAKTSVSKAKAPDKKGSVRKKLAKDSIDLSDLEKLNEENIKSHTFRNKRNQVIIVILSILLAIAITFIVIFMVMSKVENNCFLYTHGNVQASYIVEGTELTEFRSPANIQGDCVFEVDVDLKIETAGEYEVKFSVVCYYKDQILKNVVVYEPNTTTSGFTYKNDGYYHSKSTIQGGTTIRLCQGIALNEFDVDLDADDFKLEFHTHIQEV